MQVFLNGKFVPEAEAVVSVFDRSFLYGDGLYETVRVYEGKPFLWGAHWGRFCTGAEFLKIQMPFNGDEMGEHAARLIELNAVREGMLRMVLSRGVGPRGCSPKGADQPTLVMSTHPAPDPSQEKPGWKMITATQRVPAGEPLAQIKNANKLPQILARAEADAAGADEALLLNTNGEVAEATSANIFWIKDGAIYTPPLSAGILSGLTRAVVMGFRAAIGMPVEEKTLPGNLLDGMDGVFLTVSSRGVVEVRWLDGKEIARSPVTTQLQESYAALVRRFCEGKLRV